jgi:hypothetical protein
MMPLDLDILSLCGGAVLGDLSLSGGSGAVGLCGGAVLGDACGEPCAQSGELVCMCTLGAVHSVSTWPVCVASGSVMDVCVRFLGALPIKYVYAVSASYGFLSIVWYGLLRPNCC